MTNIYEVKKNICSTVKATKECFKLKKSTRVILTVIYFFVCLSLTAGPAYNQNSCKSVWRHVSSYGKDNKKLESTMSEGLKAFQVADMLIGAFAGPFFDVYGPRVTHVVGYVFYLLGLFLNMLPLQFLFWAMVFQGFSVQTVVYPPLAISNDLDENKYLFISFIYAAPDLTAIVYVIGDFLVNWNVINADQFIGILFILSLFFAVFGYFLLPENMPVENNKPTYQEFVECQNTENMLKLPKEYETDVAYYTEYRDMADADTGCTRASSSTESLNWRSLLGDDFDSKMLHLSEVESNKKSRISWKNFKQYIRSLFQPNSDGTLSYINQVIRLTLRVESLCLLIAMPTCWVISNLYLDISETVLYAYGDTNHYIARSFGIFLHLNAIACVVLGWIVQKTSSGFVIILINIAGAITLILAMIPMLRLQYLTFVAFNIFRGGILSVCTTFCMSAFGFQYVGYFIGLCMIVTGLVNMYFGNFMPDVLTTDIPFLHNILQKMLFVCLLNFIPCLVIYYCEKKISQKNVNPISEP